MEYKTSVALAVVVVVEPEVELVVELEPEELLELVELVVEEVEPLEPLPELPLEVEPKLQLVLLPESVEAEALMAEPLILLESFTST